MPRSPDGNRSLLFDQLFAASRDAHANGQHEVAYHALIAAMHAAQDAKDVEGARAVAKEAQAQIEWIDRHAPGHRLSTESAARHNHPGVYVMLTRQAGMIGDMMGPRSR